MKPIQPQNIPDELKAYPNWVTHINKVPYTPATRRRASVIHPSTWRTFDTAMTSYQQGWTEGIGFVFTQSPFAGVDFDHLADRADFLAALDIAKLLNSYTEVSQSGNGLHIIIRAQLPPGPRRTSNIEMYDSGRYFIMTGHHWPGTPATIQPRQLELERLHAKLFPVKLPPSPSHQRGHGGDAQAVLQKALTARNGDKFARLYAGNTDGYPSHSEADLALASMLVYWSNGDPALVDRLFRDSGLMRPKWLKQHAADGRTYGELTVQRALS